MIDRAGAVDRGAGTQAEAVYPWGIAMGDLREQRARNYFRRQGAGARGRIYIGAEGDGPAWVLG